MPSFPTLQCLHGSPQSSLWSEWEIFSSEYGPEMRMYSRQELPKGAGTWAIPTPENTYLLYEESPGTLGTLNNATTQETQGQHPCHGIQDAQGDVWIAHYTDSTLSLYSNQKWQSFQAPPGSGPDAQRQEQSHLHHICAVPNSPWLLICDLGGDRILIWNQSTRQWHGDIPTPPGSGPRHLELKPCGTKFWVTAELSCALLIYTWDPKQAQAQLEQSIELKNLGIPGCSRSHPRDYPSHLSWDSKRQRLWIAIRGADLLVSLHFEDHWKIQHILPAGVAFPRHFCLDIPSGLLCVGGQFDAKIACFDTGGTSIHRILQITSPQPIFWLGFGKPAK
jgi:6-phosphogluconolactonase (cycloisomerase 2 family)